MTKTYKTKAVKERFLDTVTCNKCGKVIENPEDLVSPTYTPWESFEVNWGYGSRHDYQTWRFDLCEECLENFCNSFAVGVPSS